MELKLLSRYRDQLFGISILSIIIFHFTEDYANAYKAHLVSFNLPVIGYYKAIGSIGVEVFMFLSGMGLYYAMRKGPSLGMFYKKRAIRLITYIPVGICLWGMWDFWLYYFLIFDFFIFYF